MELDKLIEELNVCADTAGSCGTARMAKAMRKAAETIKLLRECIVDADNEKWHRMIDDMEKKDAEQSS